MRTWYSPPEVTDWKSFLAWVTSDSVNGNYYWRGQSVDSPITPSLMRRSFHGSDSFSPNLVAYSELKMLREFRHRYRLLDPRNGSEPQSDADWYSLMQHAGIPTRLVDFTSSPFVAAYFGLGLPDEPIVIYGIHKMALFGFMAHKYADSHWIDWYKKHCERTGTRENYWAVNTESGVHYPFPEPELFYEYVTGTFREGIYLFEPEFLHHRLAVQQGVFLYPGRLIASFEEELSSVFAVLPRVNDQGGVKVTFSPEYRKELLNFLLTCNIHGLSLFDGADGLGKFVRNLGELSIREEY